jgi:hypothetical protein
MDRHEDWDQTYGGLCVMKPKNQKRVILISIPKAGTYLTFEILKKLG